MSLNYFPENPYLQNAVSSPAGAASSVAGAGGAGGGLWNNLGGLQGAAAGVNALASLWGTINAARYNKKMLEEQRKARERTEKELDRRNALQDQYQANVNSVW